MGSAGIEFEIDDTLSLGVGPKEQILPMINTYYGCEGPWL